MNEHAVTTTVIRERVPGIEALRGIAVLAVIVNHLDTSYLPGGFLGVDVFFVISGFVISNSLHKLQWHPVGTFLAEFYVRRIRRLFPALFVCVVVTIAVGTFLVEGFDEYIMRTGASSLLGLSNLYQIRIGNDYFGLGSQLNLLTHTWSLGVEEQFYLVFPLFMYFLLGNRNRNMFILIVLILVSYSIFFTLRTYGKVNYFYYFPFSRFWEILIGAAAYHLSQRTAHQGFAVASPRNAGIALVLLAGCFLPPADYILFTAPAACLLSAFVILSTLTTPPRILETRFLTFTGEISYSLYLYHVPVITILAFGDGVPSLAARLLAVYAIAFISYRCIELPLRRERLRLPRLATVAASGALAIVAAGSIYALSKDTTAVDPFAPPRGEAFRSCAYDDLTDPSCYLNAPNRPKLFFVGDSHSHMLVPMMRDLHSDHGYQVQSIATSGLFTTEFSSDYGDLSARGDKIMRFLRENGRPGDTVIVTNQFVGWFSNELVGSYDTRKLYLDGQLVDQKRALQIHTSDLGRMAETLERLRMNMVVILPFPDFEHHPKTCYVPLRRYLGNFGLSAKCRTTRSNQEMRRKPVVEAFSALAATHPNMHLFDPIRFFCDARTCSSYSGGLPLYYDDDHVNYNAANLIRAAFTALIEKASATNQASRKSLQ